MNSNPDNVIDATLLEPRVRHATIFEKFNGLSQGDSFILQNDHDPVPLYYQFVNQFGEAFTWEHIEKGPDLFKIRITKGGNTIHDETLAEIAVKDVRKALIFKKYDLNFCCGGKKTIKQACSEKGLDFTMVEKELQQANSTSSSRPLPYDEWNIDFLSDYIVNTHHSFARKRLPDLKFYAEKVYKKHVHQHSELENLYKLVLDVEDTFLAHMNKEEKLVFPYIKKLVAASNDRSVNLNDQLGKVMNPLSIIIAEHEKVGGYFDEIKVLSSDYTLPTDACGSYNLYYRLLEEFEDDFQLHVYLENNILFPKALALEEELKDRN